ncbi:MAG: hypothetical protein HOE90_00130 [Bacteriovoracaceae bacterium]|jgi:pimeloyl-ACP methyl ester carboxylesterase|nr:hypothetical protein [Bacteriovoracaceae bacterium]
MRSTLLLVALSVFTLSTTLYASSEKPIIFFISGIAGSDFSTLEPLFKKKGFDFYFVPGMFGGTTDQRAKFTIQKIKNRLKPNQNCHIVAHSYGGLIARYMISKYLEQYQLNKKCLSLYTTASPHGGSPLADIILKIMKEKKLDLDQAIADMLINESSLSDVEKSKAIARYQTLKSIAGKLSTKSFSKKVAKLKLDFVNGLNQANTVEMKKFNKEIKDRDDVLYKSVAFYMGKEEKKMSFHHKKIHQLFYYLASIVDKSLNKASTGRFHSDGIAPTETMKLGELIGCFKTHHLSTFHNYPYNGGDAKRDTIVDLIALDLKCSFYNEDQRKCRKLLEYKKGLNSCTSEQMVTKAN